MDARKSHYFCCQLPDPHPEAANILEGWARGSCSDYALASGAGGGTALLAAWPEGRTAKSHKLMLRKLAQKHTALRLGELKDFTLLSEAEFKERAEALRQEGAPQTRKPSVEPQEACTPTAGKHAGTSMADRAANECANGAAAEFVESLPGGFDAEAKLRYDRLMRTGRRAIAAR